MKMSVGGESLRGKGGESSKWDLIGNGQQWLTQELSMVPSNTALCDSTCSKMYQ